MATHIIPDISGVFTNADPDDLKPGQIEKLENFRPINGKLVKTHGASDTGEFPSLNHNLSKASIVNLVSVTNEHFPGQRKDRIIVVKVGNEDSLVTLEFNQGI
ncbi:hypothetical protein CL634_00700 [bacterium]|nr:hypothetical protein [bacterium]